MLGASWELFMHHGGDKGEQCLTGSTHRARTALLRWLRLWLRGLVNINGIPCVAWKAPWRLELRCSFCCTGTRRDRAALAGVWRGGETWGTGTVPGTRGPGLHTSVGQGGRGPCCPELCYPLLAPHPFTQPLSGQPGCHQPAQGWCWAPEPSQAFPHFFWVTALGALSLAGTCSTWAFGKSC